MVLHSNQLAMCMFWRPTRANIDIRAGYWVFGGKNVEGKELRTASTGPRVSSQIEFPTSQLVQMSTMYLPPNAAASFCGTRLGL